MDNVIATSKWLKYSPFLIISVMACGIAYMRIGYPSNSMHESRVTLLHKNAWNYSGLALISSERHAFNKTCKGFKKRLPNCLIIGTAKSGTMALLTFLTAHPRIVRNEDYNEMHFFTLKYENGLEWYRDQMPYSCYGQIVIEKSPDYFVNEDVPRRVFRMNPNIRLLLIVRDPIQRAISAYYHAKRQHEKLQKRAGHKLTEPYPSFESSWKRYVHNYQYVTHFENWLKYFKKQQIHVIDGDAMSGYPVPELNKVEDFLNIEHYLNDKRFVFNSTKGFYCLRNLESREDSNTDNADCLYETKGHSHPNVSSSVIKKMKLYLRAESKRFFSLIGKNFDWNI